jgi:CheY-like chemotaxis protein
MAFLLDLAFTEAGRSVEIVQVARWCPRHSNACVRRPVRCRSHSRLIIIDLNLPKVDGLELLLGLKGWPELTRVPMVILTTSPTTRERERVQDLHCVLAE